MLQYRPRCFYGKVNCVVITLKNLAMSDTPIGKSPARTPGRRPGEVQVGDAAAKAMVYICGGKFFYSICNCE